MNKRYGLASGSRIMSTFTVPENEDCPDPEAILLPFEATSSTHYINESYECVEIPPSPGTDFIFAHEKGQWIDPRPVLLLLENARASINTWRDEQEKIGTLFEHGGRMWDCNPAAKDKLQSTATMDALPPGFFWTDASEPVNQDVPMDIADVRALNEAHKIAYFERGLQIHVRQREMKAALEAMDFEQLAAFVPGWAD